MPDDISTADFFVGTLPANLVFEMQVEELCDLARQSASLTGLPDAISEQTNMPDTLSALCLIGLVAYFEAFCKDHFASLLNICPQLVGRLKQQKHDVSIDAAELLDLGSSIDHKAGFPEYKLGFLLAERYKFGTAREINARYQALLLITPFSREDKGRFDQLLNDRNLLVHHGGVYNTRYAQEILNSESPTNRVFVDSLIVNEGDVISAATFLSRMAFKIAEATQEALNRFVSEHHIEQPEVNKRAVNALTWGI
jgi:hypothetical protein